MSARAATGRERPRACSGVLGALLAGGLLAPLRGEPLQEGFFSLSAVLVSLLGAVVLVGLVNVLRRGRIR